MRFKSFLAFAVAAIAFSTPAAAVPFDTSPITADYYVEHNGLYWAWASPVSIEYFGDNVLYGPEVQEGWRYATDEEFANFPPYWLFGNWSEQRCAARFFNSAMTYCDWGDIVGGAVTNVWREARDSNLLHLDELFYVKDINFTPVPEPASLGLVGLGLAAGGFAVRRRLKKAN